VDAFALIGGDRSLAGSQIGSPGRIAEMLEFAAAHGVRAEVETVPMADAGQALERTRRNLARYRMVLVNP
jgi:D-arabinose 1-dehydrogenase-like Zn-dependent alcohol dehydrogenase